MDSIENLDSPAVARSFRKTLKKYSIPEKQDNHFEFDDDIDIKTVNLYYAKNNWILIGLEFLDALANPILKIGTGTASRKKTLDLDAKSRIIGAKAQAG